MSAEISDELREKRREWGRQGGKRRLETMTKAKRTALAYQSGVKGGAPRRIDHEKVKALRVEGLKHREIAVAMEISMPSVARILKEAKKG
jgi:predicted DNA-binding protein (UPF0251 family)